MAMSRAEAEDSHDRDSLMTHRVDPAVARLKALEACAEFLAELVRSDQVMDEQADEASDILAKAGIEV